MSDQPLTHARAALDSAHAKLATGRVHEAMRELVGGLASLRRSLSDDAWAGFVQGVGLAHPIREVLHQDPLSRRAFLRPRGYAGDAETLDYIYNAESPDWCPHGASDLGRQIFRFTADGPTALGFRNRRRVVARVVDEVASRHATARVLALDAGHLREADLCRAVQERLLGAYVAVEQDGQALGVLAQDYLSLGVTPVHGSIHDILERRLSHGPFDLVYAASLLDHLSDSIAQTLVSVVLRMVRPGGRLLVATALPDPLDRGYLECYMGWRIAYRTEKDLLGLLRPDQGTAIGGTVLFHDPSDTVAFLEVHRA
jgi:extracellular factor (EF) 3-hydroxypalmitic acid methyl ester biosynthesis protein